MLTRLTRNVVLFTLPCGLLVSLAAAGTLAAENVHSPAPAVAAKSGERLREGATLHEVAGSFQFAGDRIAFHPEGTSDSLRVLENLALERVGRIIAEGRAPQVWAVSGLVTEYRGANYLLVTKAVVKLREESPPGPRPGPVNSPVSPPAHGR